MILKENIATKDRVSHLCSKKVHNFGIFEVNKAIFISSVLLNTHSYTQILIKWLPYTTFIIFDRDYQNKNA